MSTDISSEEKFLPLPDGRTLAYEEAGNPSSKTVVLYMHGFFTVGDASQTSHVLLNKNVHFITPTLPGWGNTDMTTLLSHLYPDFDGRGSLGTVPAQILYGAPYDKFPFGRCISGMLLLGAFSPFRYQKDYAKHMTWTQYILPGPIGYYMPFNLLAHLIKFVLVRKLKTIEGAEASLRETVFDLMDQAEREEFAKWSEERGMVPDDTVRTMAKNVMKSTSKSWEGFMLTPPLLHSDWGFRPDALDEDHSRPPILLTASKDDHMTPVAYAYYLAANYKNARIKHVDGGHMSTLYYMDEVWTEFLADEQ
ncbi:Alpha/Beta hydrolase protein [Suillus bovinus]|uniref:Alpha/Beta hydrolase protein n=1 Tax=Suillus bovinus TaxID=48563 RepID=UPI001B86B368|nr:Alpha/Beta hydrolase protein [Suillus bovinus]KAG2158804.1 Alpha/Beta hydrolase protein [Suillus bovinus]